MISSSAAGPKISPKGHLSLQALAGPCPLPILAIAHSGHSRLNISGRRTPKAVANPTTALVDGLVEDDGRRFRALRSWGHALDLNARTRRYQGTVRADGSRRSIASSPRRGGGSQGLVNSLPRHQCPAVRPTHRERPSGLSELRRAPLGGSRSTKQPHPLSAFPLWA